jgi:hypothetical protein
MYSMLERRMSNNRETDKVNWWLESKKKILWVYRYSLRRESKLFLPISIPA